MNKNILILSNKEKYIKNIFKNESIDINFVYHDVNILKKIIRRILGFFHLNDLKIGYDFEERKIDLYDIILIFECTYPLNIIKYIRSKNKTCRIIYWLWNPVSTFDKRFMYDRQKEFLDLLKKRYDTNLNFEIWSFDKNDCKKYKLQYNNQVSYKIKISNKKIKWDFFFCGKDKNRLEKIKKLEEKFPNYKFKILIFPDKGKYYSNGDKKYILSKMISYSEIVEYINQSRCIIDIVQKGQGGITWRPLEAMFYKKKLLTNYLDIQKYDFYNAKNIFILGKDDLNVLSDFLNDSYDEISKETVKNYTAKGWINNFIKFK